MLPPINLSRHWQASTDGAAWQSLSALADWPPPPLTLTEAVYLRRSVMLTPLDGCVRYWLHLEVAPAGTEVIVNGWRVGVTNGGSFRANVTDQVALDDNLIELVVRQPGAFGHVYLQAVPCE
ncbi:MAG: hypothetical protein HZC41_21005 [Chloroflexi bacterium]|nr:hypothetical protein [Chloroflexota bacterium]